MRFNKAVMKQSLQAGRKLAQSETGRKAISVARVAAQSGPVREVAALCGRAGMAGAVVDAAMGGMQAAGALRDGRLDGAGAARHVAAEAGCGFVTSASGTAGTVAIYMLTGSMGPAALALGMGASMGSRWAYRKVVGETLPEAGVVRPVEESAAPEKDDDGFEEIGPK